MDLLKIHIIKAYITDKGIHKKSWTTNDYFIKDSVSEPSEQM